MKSKKYLNSVRDYLQKMTLATLTGIICAGSANAEMIGFWNYDATLGFNSATGTTDLNLVGNGVSNENGVYSSTGSGYLRGNGSSYSIANLPTGSGAYSISTKAANGGTGSTNTNTGYGLVGWGNYSTKQCNALRTMANSQFRHYWWASDLDVTTPTPFNGDWYHVVATSNGTSQNVYLNGQLLGSKTSSGHNMQNSNFTIGSTNATGKEEILKGSMDDTSVYSHELSHGDVVNLVYAPSIGMTGWWVESDVISGNQKADRLFGSVWSEDLQAEAKTVVAGDSGQTMLFNRVLNAKENAYFNGQTAKGHAYQMDADVATWSDANTAWVYRKSLTFDGSVTPLGIYVGGTTTGVTLSVNGNALDSTNLVMVLPGGTLNVGSLNLSSTPIYVNGGAVKGSSFFTGNGSEITLNSGSISVSELRVGNGASDGCLTVNGGAVTTGWLTAGESGSQSSKKSSVVINNGVVTSNGNGTVMIGRGGKGELLINGGTLNANGKTNTTDGALNIGSHNEALAKITDGTLNVNGVGTKRGTGYGLYIGSQNESTSWNSTFIQEGGLVNIGADSNLAIGAGGAYLMSGGTLATPAIYGSTNENLQITGGLLSPGGKGVVGKTYVEGDLKLTGDSSYEVTFFQNSSDLLLVDGILSLDVLLTPDLVDDLDENEEYVLIASKNPILTSAYSSIDDWAFAQIDLGLIATVKQDSSLVSGYDYVVSARAADYNSVPEPASWALLLLGCGLLFCKKRKCSALSLIPLCLGPAFLTGCGGPEYPVCRWEGAVQIDGLPIPESATGSISVASTDPNLASRAVSAPIVNGKYALENVPQGDVVVQFNIIEETPAKNPDDAARGMTDAKDLIPKNFQNGIKDTAAKNDNNKNFDIRSDQK